MLKVFSTSSTTDLTVESETKSSSLYLGTNSGTYLFPVLYTYTLSCTSSSFSPSCTNLTNQQGNNLVFIKKLIYRGKSFIWDNYVNLFHITALLFDYFTVTIPAIHGCNIHI